MKKIINYQQSDTPEQAEEDAGIGRKVPLHYATRYWNDWDFIMKRLLELGGMASISETSNGKLEKPIDSIKTKVSIYLIRFQREGGWGL